MILHQKSVSDHSHTENSASLPFSTKASLVTIYFTLLHLLCPLLPLLARQQGDTLNSKELSTSIAAESPPSTQTRQTLPEAETLLPSIPFAMTDGSLTGALNPESANMQYHGKKSIATLGLGFGYFKPEIGSIMNGGQFELATMLGDHVAIGSTITLFNDRKDLVFNTLWQLHDSGIRLKASGGYLRGNQNFDFPSGEANIELGQFSYSFATKYIFNESEETGTLQSIGLSAWGAEANQKSTADGPRSFMQQTATDYLIMSDPLKLSEGRLLGAAADIQVALLSNLIVKGSLGYEQIHYPFSDGTGEHHKNISYSIDLFSEPFSALFLGVGYRAAASENRTTIVAETANWQLSAFHNEGQNGVADNNGMILSCHIALPTRKQQDTLAQRMKPTRSGDMANLLADALTRPAQLPQSFLAKVDPSAVSLAATLCKDDALNSATIKSNGDLFITVGNGSPTVTGVTQNGSPCSYSTLATTTSTQVVLHTRQFPEPTGASDTWVISVTDSTLTSWFVTLIARK